MKNQTNQGKQRKWLRFLAVVLFLGVIISVGYQYNSSRAADSTTDTGLARTIFYPSKPQSQQYPAVEIQDNEQLRQISALTGDLTLNTITTGTAGEMDDHYYKWSVKKIESGSAVGMSSYSYEKDNQGSGYNFNGKIQSVLAGGKLHDDKYGDLVLVEAKKIKVKSASKYPKDIDRDDGTTEWITQYEDNDTTPTLLASEDIQYFDRLKYEDGKWVSKYTDWAKANGVTGGKDGDDDKDGYLALYGGKEGGDGVVNDSLNWSTLKSNWEQVFCGTKHTQTITAKPDGSVDRSPVFSDASEYYCYEDSVSLPGNTKMSERDCDNDICLNYDNNKYIQQWISEAQTAGQDVVKTTFPAGDGEGKTIYVCGASDEFRSTWENVWKMYKNDDGELKGLDYDDARDACHDAAKGEYERYDGFVNLTNCFVREETTGKEIQIGCYHDFPNAKDSSTGKEYSTGDNTFANYEEFVWGTDPKTRDTDGDGVRDEGDIAGYGQKIAKINLSDLKNLPGGGNSGASFDFKVSAEVRSQVAQKLVGNTTAMQSKIGYRVYHVTDEEGADTDTDSKVKISVKAYPTFPNIREDTIFEATVGSGGLPITSPDQLKYEWYLDKGDTPETVTASEHQETIVGDNRYSHKIEEVGMARMTVKVYQLNGSGPGKDKYLGTASAEAAVWPGFKLTTNAGNTDNCFMPGETAQVIPVTQKRNGNPYYKWYIDGSLFKTTSIFDPEKGITPDWDAIYGSTENNEKKNTDEIALTGQALSLEIKKEVGSDYLVQMAYTTSDSYKDTNWAVASTKVKVCDASEGTEILIDEGKAKEKLGDKWTEKLDYRASGISSLNGPKSVLATKNTVVPLMAKLGPLLEGRKDDILYGWAIVTDDSTVKVEDLQKEFQDNATAGSFTTADKVGVTYTVELTVTDASRPNEKITKQMEIETVDSITKAETTSTPASSPRNLDELFDIFRNYKKYVAEKGAGVALAMMIQGIFRLGLILAGVMAAVMIAWGGFDYLIAASTANVGASSEAKDKITSAIMGLLLAFIGYALLNQINPELLNIRVPSLPKAEKAGQTTQQQSAVKCRTRQYKDGNTCKDRVAVGKPCNTKTLYMCANNSYCKAEKGNSGVCTRRTSGLTKGTSCNTTTTPDACDAGLYCKAKSGTTGTCQEKLKAGESCTKAGDCKSAKCESGKCK